MISELASHGDDVVDEAEAAAAMARLSKLLASGNTLGFDPARKGRRVVMAGLVHFSSGGVFRGVKARAVVLLNDALLVCKRDRTLLSVKQHVDFAEAFAAAGPAIHAVPPAVRVEDCDLSFVEARAAALRGETGPATAPQPFSFRLCLPSGELTMRAQNAAEKRRWVANLSKCLASSCPLEARIAHDVAGLIAHRFRDDTLHAAVALSSAVRADVLGLCSAEGIGRASGELGHGVFDPETLLADPHAPPQRSGDSGAGQPTPAEAAAARSSPATVAAAADPFLASLVAALELSVRELEAAASDSVSAEGSAEALALVAAFAAGDKPRGGVGAAAAGHAPAASSGSWAASENDAAGFGLAAPLPRSAAGPAAAGSRAGDGAAAAAGGVVGGVAMDGAEAFASRAQAALLGGKVDCDAEDGAERTALLLAAETGELECARALLRMGCDVAAVNSDMRCAVSLAARKGHATLVATLVQHGSPVSGRGATDLLGETALEAAFAGPDAGAACQIVDAMVAAGATARADDGSAVEGVTLAHRAVLRGGGFEACLPSLVAAGVDINSPLLETVAAAAAAAATTAATASSEAAAPPAAKAGSADAARRRAEEHQRAALLLPVGAEVVPGRGCGGLTALHLACGAGLTGDAATAQLLRTVAEGWVADSSSGTLVAAAPGLGSVSPAAVALLLKCGAKPNLRSGPSTGCSTPLHFIGRALASTGPAAAAELAPLDRPAAAAAVAALLGAGARPAVVDGSGAASTALLASAGLDLEAAAARFSSLPAPEGVALTTLGGAAVAPGAEPLPPAAQAARQPSASPAAAQAGALRVCHRMMRAPCAVALAQAAFLPDSAALCCMGCGAEFGWFQRRHHCRSCNAVVCGDCSSKAAPLLAPGTDPLREAMSRAGRPAAAAGPASEASVRHRVCDGCFCKFVADWAAAEARKRERQRDMERARAAVASRKSAELREQAAERGMLMRGSEDRAGGAGSGAAGGLSEVQDVMQDNLAALRAQGERLREVADQSAAFAATGADFAAAARQLEAQQKQRVFGLF